jgi:hypothetical protein
MGDRAREPMSVRLRARLARSSKTLWGTAPEVSVGACRAVLHSVVTPHRRARTQAFGAESAGDCANFRASCSYGTGSSGPTVRNVCERRLACSVSIHESVSGSR